MIAMKTKSSKGNIKRHKHFNGIESGMHREVRRLDDESAVNDSVTD